MTREKVKGERRWWVSYTTSGRRCSSREASRLGDFCARYVCWPCSRTWSHSLCNSLHTERAVCSWRQRAQRRQTKFAVSAVQQTIITTQKTHTMLDKALSTHPSIPLFIHIKLHPRTYSKLTNRIISVKSLWWQPTYYLIMCVCQHHVKGRTGVLQNNGISSANQFSFE